MKRFFIVLSIVVLLTACSSFKFSAEKLDAEVSKVAYIQEV